MTRAQVAEWILSALVLVPALRVVNARNLVHGVLWLGVTLVGTAAVYLQLSAPFVAAIQVLLYAGGVVILLIFGVMLTRRHDGLAVRALHADAWRGIGVAGALFGALTAAVIRTPRPAPPIAAGAEPLPSLGQSLLTEHVLAFEVLSLLLLAAMIGAVVIARRRDPEGA